MVAAVEDHRTRAPMANRLRDRIVEAERLERSHGPISRTLRPSSVALDAFLPVFADRWSRAGRGRRDPERRTPRPATVALVSRPLATTGPTMITDGQIAVGNPGGVPCPPGRRRRRGAGRARSRQGLPFPRGAEGARRRRLEEPHRREAAPGGLPPRRAGRAQLRPGPGAWRHCAEPGCAAARSFTSATCCTSPAASRGDHAPADRPRHPAAALQAAVGIVVPTDDVLVLVVIAVRDDDGRGAVLVAGVGACGRETTSSTGFYARIRV